MVLSDRTIRRLLVALDLDQLGEVLHRLADVDERVARVVEDAEEAVDPHVDARGLQQRLVVRLDLDAALREQPADRPVGQDHAPILRLRRELPARAR